MLKKKIYQILIEMDGVGLVGSVTQLFAYPDNAAEVSSMATSNGNLYFSSEGLFQVNLISRVVTCVIRASSHCKVHGIAPFK